MLKAVRIQTHFNFIVDLTSAFVIEWQVDGLQVPLQGCKQVRPISLPKEFRHNRFFLEMFFWKTIVRPKFDALVWLRPGYRDVRGSSLLFLSWGRRSEPARLGTHRSISTGCSTSRNFDCRSSRAGYCGGQWRWWPQTVPFLGEREVARDRLLGSVSLWEVAEKALTVGDSPKKKYSFTVSVNFTGLLRYSMMASVTLRVEPR